MFKLCTKFERNRTLRGGVITIVIFDPMTNIVQRLALGCEIIFTKYEFGQFIRSSLITLYC